MSAALALAALALAFVVAAVVAADLLARPRPATVVARRDRR